MDCQTIFWIAVLICIWRGWNWLDKNAVPFLAASITVIRILFVVLLVVALGIGGFTGEELFIGAAWAAIEFLVGPRRKPRDDDDTIEYE